MSKVMPQGDTVLTEVAMSPYCQFPLGGGSSMVVMTPVSLMVVAASS